MMTFSEWQETKREISRDEAQKMYVDGVDIDESYESVLMYEGGLYVGKVGDKYHLHIAGEEWLNTKLFDLECILYAWYTDECAE